ncbi:isochorismatase family protein [Bacillus mycoides]|uniref:isochorismatase family protein n=1 Tax=Bacillus mycoides TaxID=1405 RepID=UPI003F74CF20
MKALLVIDVQNGIVNLGDFKEELSLMENVINDFKESNSPVIFMKHLDDTEESPLCRGSIGSELHDSLKDYADYVLEKQTPSSFFNTELSNTLDKLGVNHLFIIGFETEFCCMFTAICAFDRGYKVTFIKDAAGTTNTDKSYEMQGLDIRNFVGKVLKWSSVIEVLDYERYVEEYKTENTI